jgi:hypothetical protein
MLSSKEIAEQQQLLATIVTPLQSTCNSGQ